MTWRTAPIRRVAKLGSGHTPSRQHPEYWVDCTIPWLTLADVNKLRDGTRTVIDETEEMISPLGVANSAAVVHPAGTVALSRTASVGFSCILGRDMATSQDFATWTCGPLLDPRFLLYSLRGQPEQIRERMIGSTHKTIYMPDIETLTTPLPPLESQQTIYHFLDVETARIDSLVAHRRRMINLLEERRWAVAETAFETATPQLVPMKRVARYFMDGDWIESPFITTSGMRLIQTGNIGRGEFVDQGDRYISDDTFRHLGCSEVFPGDVLISRLANTVGQACAAPDLGARMVTSVDVVILRPRESVSAEYLVRYMNTGRHLSLARLEARGTTMQRLARSQLGQLPVALADRAHQEQVVREIDRATAHINAASGSLRRQLQVLQERKQALITAAVTGQLDLAREIAEEAS